MGIDLICWKDCALQEALGVEGFRAKMRLAAYKATAEAVAPDRLDRLKIRVQVEGAPPQTMTYAGLRGEIEDACRLAPDCAACLRSQGSEGGSYHHVSYPVDETCEQLLFEYFVEQAPERNSACNQVYRDVVANLPREGLAWHTRRGTGLDGDLAVLPEPLVHRFDPPIDGHDYLDSAQILAALFRTLETTAEIMAYGVLWDQFERFVEDLELSADEGSESLSQVVALADFFKLAAARTMTGGCSVLVFA